MAALTAGARLAARPARAIAGNRVDRDARRIGGRGRATTPWRPLVVPVGEPSLRRRRRPARSSHTASAPSFDATVAAMDPTHM